MNYESTTSGMRMILRNTQNRESLFSRFIGVFILWALREDMKQLCVDTLSNHPDLGILSLRNLMVTGQVQILTRTDTGKAKLIAGNIDVVTWDPQVF